MNQQEMHDEQIKDKLRMKDEALKKAIGFAETSSLISGELYYQYKDIVINTCKKALEA